MKKSTKLPKGKIEDALHKAKGRVYIAATLLDVTPQTVYSALQRWPEMAAIKEFYEGRMLDFAENKLEDAIYSGDVGVIKWYLGTKGKHRGYGANVEISGDTNITLKWDDTGLEEV